MTLAGIQVFFDDGEKDFDSFKTFNMSMGQRKTVNPSIRRTRSAEALIRRGIFSVSLPIDIIAKMAIY